MRQKLGQYDRRLNIVSLCQRKYIIQPSDAGKYLYFFALDSNNQFQLYKLRNRVYYDSDIRRIFFSEIQIKEGMFYV